MLDSVEAVVEHCLHWEEHRHDLGYEIDGVVIKVDDLDATRASSASRRGRRAGRSPTSSRPRSARRCCATSRSRSAAPDAPRRSRCSSRCSSAARRSAMATLHNQDQVAVKDVRPGDTVIVRKAGDVIPEVVGPILSARPADSVPWVFPTICPCPLKSTLVRPEGEADTRCVEPACPFQRDQRIIYWASRGAMDIEGLGERTVVQLTQRRARPRPGRHLRPHRRTGRRPRGVRAHQRREAGRRDRRVARPTAAAACSPRSASATSGRRHRRRWPRRSAPCGACSRPPTPNAPRSRASAA